MDLRVKIYGIALIYGDHFGGARHRDQQRAVPSVFWRDIQNCDGHTSMTECACVTACHFFDMTLIDRHR